MDNKRRQLETELAGANKIVDLHIAMRHKFGSQSDYNKSYRQAVKNQQKIEREYAKFIVGR